MALRAGTPVEPYEKQYRTMDGTVGGATAKKYQTAQ